MRCTQIMGLPQEAEEYLGKHVVRKVLRSCPKCGEPIDFGPKATIYASAKEQGMFDDGPNLYDMS